MACCAFARHRTWAPRARAYALLLAAALLAACRGRPPVSADASDPAPLPVRVLQVQAEPFAATVTVTGTLVSNARVEVKAQTIGRVVRFDKQEGERVAAGEPIVWVDEENYRLAARQAETAVEVSQAALERTRVLEAHQRSELDRARNLVQSGGITEKDLQAAQVAERDARAQTALAAAQLEQARAALEVARKHLRDAVIRAPVSGELEKRSVNPGAYVEAPTPVFTIVDNRRLELESPVASADLAPLRAGQRVTFAVNSFPGTVFEGRVVEINPALDPDTRSAKVRVRVDNRAGRLRAGMFAEGEIFAGVTARAIVVPAAAVYREDRSAAGALVYVVENHKAARRSVRVGREKDSRLEILEGLRPGDLLIAEQSLELADGAAVEPRK